MSHIRRIVSDFRPDESFPVKTGSCQKIMVEVQPLNPQSKRIEKAKEKRIFVHAYDKLPVRTGNN